MYAASHCARYELIVWIWFFSSSSSGNSNEKDDEERERFTEQALNFRIQRVFACDGKSLGSCRANVYTKWIPKLKDFYLHTHTHVHSPRYDRRRMVKKKWNKFASEIASNGCYILALGITASDLMMMMMMTAVFDAVFVRMSCIACLQPHSISIQITFCNALVSRIRCRIFDGI